MAARIADNRKRKRVLHQIEVDKGFFLQEDNTMDEGVVPTDLLSELETTRYPEKCPSD
jgi:hypothetical protein